MPRYCRAKHVDQVRPWFTSNVGLAGLPLLGHRAMIVTKSAEQFLQRTMHTQSRLCSRVLDKPVAAASNRATIPRLRKPPNLIRSRVCWARHCPRYRSFGPTPRTPVRRELSERHGLTQLIGRLNPGNHDAVGPNIQGPR